LENAELILMYFDVCIIKCRTYVHIVDRTKKRSETGCCELYLVERRGVYIVLVVKPEEKSPLGRPRLRRKENIKMILKKWDVG
jgi:hypothetical protein